MKKICFLILMLVGVSVKSNALQFSELCSDLLNNHISSMTINYDNGASTTIGMAEACQEFIKFSEYRDNSWMDGPITNFSLGVAAISVGVILPCLQCIGSYAYRKIKGYKSVEEKVDDVRILLDGNADTDEAPADYSILGKALSTDETMNGMRALLNGTSQNVGSIREVLGNSVNNDEINVLEGGTLVTHLVDMRGHLVDMRGQIQAHAEQEEGHNDNE